MRLVGNTDGAMRLVGNTVNILYNEEAEYKFDGLVLDVPVWAGILCL
jgi:hypothetical protein